MVRWPEDSVGWCPTASWTCPKILWIKQGKVSSVSLITLPNQEKACSMFKLHSQARLIAFSQLMEKSPHTLSNRYFHCYFFFYNEIF